LEDATRPSKLVDGKGTAAELMPNSASLDKETIDRDDKPPLEPKDDEGGPSALMVPEILL